MEISSHFKMYKINSFLKILFFFFFLLENNDWGSEITKASFIWMVSASDLCKVKYKNLKMFDYIFFLPLPGTRFPEDTLLHIEGLWGKKVGNHWCWWKWTNLSQNIIQLSYVNFTEEVHSLDVISMTSCVDRNTACSDWCERFVCKEMNLNGYWTTAAED